MNFIDSTRIYVKGGNGGNGCIAFLREKYRPKGGPSGGDGGHGGNIILQVDSNLSTLQDLAYKKQYIASNGQHGRGNNMHGKNGCDIVINVPPGTIVKDVKNNVIIIDLKEVNQLYLIAKGGNGGFGNAKFKTKINTAPRVANTGLHGAEFELELELKVLADIGLVGFPNAGKSTFIKSISNAKPKIADYPFTTLVPNLGIVKYVDYKTFVVADIPGIIEGASAGKGLGIQFLKHIERTKVLVFIIDINSNDIYKEFDLLCKEINKHNSSLLNKPKIIFLTKCENLNKKDTENLSFNDPFLKISSIQNINLNKAIEMMYNSLQKVS